MVDPEPGWIDQQMAAAAVYTCAMLELIRELPGTLETIGDQIPVDYVSNTILAATARLTSDFDVIHSTSSTVNPLDWRMCRD